MQFIQANERTLNAIRKADALKSSSSMKVEVGSTSRTASMLYSPMYSTAQNIEAAPDTWGEFFCRYTTDMVGQKLQIGRLDWRGFSTSTAGYLYLSDRWFLSYCART